jgi:group I intron endonuclease
MYGYVYLTRNLLNGRCYIGQRKGSFDSSYYGSGVALKAALLKYGRASFSVSLLVFAEDKAHLDRLEFNEIELAKFRGEDLYNIAVGGEAGMAGFKHSQESRRKMSAAHKGVPLSPSTCAKMAMHMRGSGNHFYGRSHSEQTRRKISEKVSGERHNRWGKKVPDHVKEKIAKAHLGKPKGPMDDEHKAAIGRGVVAFWANKRTKQSALS